MTVCLRAMRRLSGLSDLDYRVPVGVQCCVIVVMLELVFVVQKIGPEACLQGWCDAGLG